jgi:hypothetical protein
MSQRGYQIELVKKIVAREWLSSCPVKVKVTEKSQTSHTSYWPVTSRYNEQNQPQIILKHV